MQIAKHMGASIVMGSSTNEGRRAQLKEFGCDLAIDTSRSQVAGQGQGSDRRQGRRPDRRPGLGRRDNQNMEAAAILGRIVNVGRLGGMKGEFNFDLHALKRIDYIGVTFRTRTPDEVRAIVKSASCRPLAGHRSGQAAPADRQDLPAVAGGRGAGAHEGQRPLRQDRPGGVIFCWGRATKGECEFAEVARLPRCRHTV